MPNLFNNRTIVNIYYRDLFIFNLYNVVKRY